MARTGMGALIIRLRRMVNDTDLGVWQDDDLEDVLDAYKARVYLEPLECEVTHTSGTSYEYKVYHSRYGNLEGGGTAYLQIEDSAGSQRGTADYTVDYIAGIVTMAADQEGTALYLSGWTYDLNAAAAQLWEERAGLLYDRYDARFGDQQLSRGQMVKHCLEMADRYKRLAKPVTVRGWSVGLFRDE